MKPKARATGRATTPPTTRGNNRQQVPDSVYKETCCPPVVLTCCPGGGSIRPPGQQQHLNNNKCVHHWDIETPRDATSLGVCRYCGIQRWFQNSRDDYGPERRIAAHTMYSTPGAKLGAWLMAEGCRE